MIFKHEDFSGLMSNEAMAKEANEKLNKLIDSCTVVYCDKDELHFSGVDEIGYTHKGYLVGVEEIKKECVEHEPDFVSQAINEKYNISKPVVCKYCGCELVQRWEKVK